MFLSESERARFLWSLGIEDLRCWKTAREMILLNGFVRNPLDVQAGALHAVLEKRAHSSDLN